jgi:hypothetical protein
MLLQVSKCQLTFIRQLKYFFFLLERGDGIVIFEQPYINIL